MDTVIKKYRQHGGIVKRWFINTFCVVVFVLAVILIFIAATLHSHYYGTARKTLESRAFSSNLSTFFSQNNVSSDAEFNSLAHEYIENFTEKNIMEVWVIGKNGKAIASTTGFSVDDSDMQDYNTALTSEDGSGLWKGRNINREKIMALTVMLPADSDGNRGAVRFIASLEDIDSQYITILFLLLLVLFFTAGLVAFSGSFFIRSIVNPVKEINEKAKILAKGDFTAQIEQFSDIDEISELCSTFNEMAKAIGESDRMKNDFISTVSHELRTPLTAIKGWGETVEESNDIGAVKTGVNIILSETDRLNSMVEDLLDFSKMESGRLTLRMQKADIFAELLDTAIVFYERAQREGIEFKYDIPVEEVALSQIDPNRIKQVFVNIIDNAFKYCDKKDSLVTLKAFVFEGKFKAIISDNGCGISAEDLPRVKEKFYKANISVKGSGIGLAVCDEIIKKHQGEFNIFSDLGIGTTVEIVLPLKK